MIGPASRFRRSDRVLVQEAAGQRILLDVDGGQYYALDEVSGRVWDLCDGSRDVAAVIAAVCEDYDAPPAVIAEDVQAFLEELAGENLIVAES